MYFGHERASQYSVLLVDNRGMGKSSRPLLRYSTSEMARDVLEVLDHVGWGFPHPARPRDPPTGCVHVCGSSMGGMIAQELACLAPSRIASLLLCSTAAALERDADTTPWPAHLLSRARALAPKTADQAVRYTAECCFAPRWLPRPDDEVELPDPGSAATPRVQPSLAADGRYRRFASNYARFAAQDVWKQRDPGGGFTRLGTLLQMVAVGWHRKTAAQLAAMADQVGRERILVLHGAEDGIIGVRHGRKLIAHLGLDSKRGVIVESKDGDGLGHAPFIERSRWFNTLLEELCVDGERLSGRS